jgi:hypothetical protein
VYDDLPICAPEAPSGKKLLNLNAAVWLYFAYYSFLPRAFQPLR